MKRYQQVLIIIAIVLVILGLGFLAYGYIKNATTKVQNPVATIEIQDFGTVKVELYPDIAPNTVSNFIALANSGFYDGLTFHRTIPSFMIQGGDPTGNGNGSPKLASIDDKIATDSPNNKEYAIKGEFIANGYNKNTLKMEKGVIAMARSDYSSISSALTEQGYNSAGSQFFIMNADNNNLNGLYAGFGKVIEGLDVVDKVANVEVVTRDQNANEGVDKPVNPPVIAKVTVDTFGVNYGKPATVEPFNYYDWLMKNYSSSNK